MQAINNPTIVPIIHPPAFAEGAESGATAQSHGAQCCFTEAAPHDDPETEHCHALWRAVIGQHIMDAKNLSAKPERQLLKQEAIDWLFHNESDFTMVCDLAGWEPDYVRSLCITAQSHAFCRHTCFDDKGEHE